MAASPAPAASVPPVEKHEIPSQEQKTTPPASAPKWQKYATPVFVLMLALAILVTVTRNWNAWEGGKVEQVTDDAYVRGDLTPLSTKVPGIVQAVHVSDYQQVHKGDLLVELEEMISRHRWIRPMPPSRLRKPG